jgi:hypothetical protein
MNEWMTTEVLGERIDYGVQYLNESGKWMTPFGSRDLSEGVLPEALATARKAYVRVRAVRYVSRREAVIQ